MIGEKSGLPAENSFNAIRLIAALQVAYIHSTWHLDIGFNPNSWAMQFPGLPMFFAISGCLVSDSLTRSKTLIQFAARRASRIYPGLVVNIAILELALFLSHLIDFTGQSPATCGLFYLLYDLTANIGFAWSWAPCGVRTAGGLFPGYPSGVLWTITVELEFYLIIPLCLLVNSRLSRTLLVSAAMAASLAFQLHLGEGIRSLSDFPNNSVLPYFWMFGIGMLFHIWRPPVWSDKYAIPALIAVIVLLRLYRGPSWVEYRINPPPWSIVQTAAVCLLALWLGQSSWLRSKFVERTDMSYGVYLYHMLFVTPLMTVPAGHRHWWFIPAVLFAAMLCGALSWHLVEKPCMRLVRSSRSLAADFKDEGSIATIAPGGVRGNVG